MIPHKIKLITSYGVFCYYALSLNSYITQACKLSGISYSYAIRVLKDMEEKGLCKLKQNGRKVEIEPTTKGRRLMINLKMILESEKETPIQLF